MRDHMMGWQGAVARINELHSVPVASKPRPALAPIIIDAKASKIDDLIKTGDYIRETLDSSWTKWYGKTSDPYPKLKAGEFEVMHRNGEVHRSRMDLGLHHLRYVSTITDTIAFRPIKKEDAVAPTVTPAETEQTEIIPEDGEVYLTYKHERKNPAFRKWSASRNAWGYNQKSESEAKKEYRFNSRDTPMKIIRKALPGEHL